MMERLWLKRSWPLLPGLLRLPLPWVVARCGSEVASDLGAAFVMIGEPWAFVVDGAMGGAREEPWEPTRGANVLKLPPTCHDSVRVMSLVRGSPFDSVRPRQTHCPCLGVKGSQVRILSSRPNCRRSDARTSKRCPGLLIV
jgi:hypothetical protein